jgi:hypothetical protein
VDLQLVPVRVGELAVGVLVARLRTREHLLGHNTTA